VTRCGAEAEEEAAGGKGSSSDESCSAGKTERYYVLGDGAEHAHMMVERFSMIQAQLLYTGEPETVIIHVGANDRRTMRNLDQVLFVETVSRATEFAETT
jgi:hypothetical protein